MSPLPPVLVLSIVLWSAEPTDAIRKVDFWNFRYIPACGSGREGVPVTNGEFRRDHPPEDRLWMKVLAVRYGDLDGDGAEEAVAHTACTSGGTGEYTQVFVYKLRRGEAVAVAGLRPGDRALGGIAEITVAGGKLAVKRKEGKAACCPDELVTTDYRLRAGNLVEVGAPMRTKYQPAAPPSQPAASGFPAGEWLLVEMGGKRVPDKAGITIQFSDDGKVWGSGGCNLYSGAAKKEKGTVVIGPLASTMRGCAADLMDQESSFLEALGNAERVAVEGSQLMIYSKGVKQPLKFGRAATP